MRQRGILAGCLTVAGMALLVASVSAVVLQYSLPLGNTYTAVVGGLLFVIGLIVLIAEIFEAWLSRSQSALVDGLQAG